MTVNEEELSEYLLNLPDKLDIMEEGIDIQTQEEYISYSDSFERGELTEDETNKLGKILFDSRIPNEAKKKALTLLAHLGTITAFRLLEEFYKSPENCVKQWTALALRECRMFLESELTEQNTGFISSGLGGRLNSLRCYFLILPANKPFTALQKDVIQKEFNYISKDLNVTLESFDLSDDFVGLTALIPFDIAIGTFIEGGISKCNELGALVLEDYYATNQNIPDKAEIYEIIKIVKGE